MKKDISEMTAEELEKHNRKIANLKPFRKAEELSPEELERQKEISIKGAIARAEKYRAKKTLKETALDVLNTAISRDDAVTMLGDKAKFIADENLTYQTAMLFMLADAVKEGNAKAFEVLRDTSGQKPKDEINLTADIMTAADRALLEKVNARITETDVKTDEKSPE